MMAGRSHSKQRTSRRLNLRFLVVSLLLFGIVFAGGTLWRSWRRSSIAAAMAQRSNELEQEGKWEEAAGYLYSYLKLRPDDAQAQIRLAKVFDRSMNGESDRTRAIDLYFRAVGLDPNQLELRERLASLLLDARRFEQARREADTLLKAETGNAVGLRVRALACVTRAEAHGQSAIEEAIVLLEEANRAIPGDEEVAKALANLYRDYQLGLSQAERDARIAQADAVMDTLVAQSTDGGTALLARFAYRRKYELEGVEKDLEDALRLAPDNVDVLIAAAEYAFRRNRTDEARGLYVRAIKAAPDDPQGYLGLGDVERSSGQIERAVAVWGKGLEKTDTNAIALRLRLIGALIESDRGDEATPHLEALETIAAQLAGHESRGAQLRLASEIDFWRAKWHLVRNEQADAIERLNRVTVTAEFDEAEEGYGSRRLEACLLLGATYARQSQWDAAAEAFDQATQLAPELTAARINAGRAWANAGRFDLASRRFESALRNNANSAETWDQAIESRIRDQANHEESLRAWNALEDSHTQTDAKESQSPIESRRSPRASDSVQRGLIAEMEGKTPRAIDAYQEAIRLGETRLGVYQRLIRLLVDVKRFDEAAACLRQIEGRLTDSPELLALGVAVAAMGKDPSFAESWYRRLYQQSPHHYEPLVRWLVMNDRTSEAVRICRDYFKNQLQGRPQSRCALKVALVLAEVILYGTPSMEDTRAADALFEPVMLAHPDNGELLFAVANVRLKQGRLEECIELLQRVTEIDPHNYLAWNNLAVVFGEQPGFEEEALRCVERAKQEAGGDLPLLIDTRAVILIALGQPAEAARLLETIVTNQEDVDSRHYLHLATAYSRLERPWDAASWLAKAEARAVEKHFLTNREREELECLRGAAMLQHGSNEQNTTEHASDTPEKVGAGAAVVSEN